jgi:hypothetical protein
MSSPASTTSVSKLSRTPKAEVGLNDRPAPTSRDEGASIRASFLPRGPRSWADDRLPMSRIGRMPTEQTSSPQEWVRSPPMHLLLAYGLAK